MKKLLLILSMIIIFFTSCGSSGGSSSSWSWGENLDFYELRFADLSESFDPLVLVEQRWRLIIDDEKMYIDGRLGDDFGVQDSEITSYTLSIASDKVVTINVSDYDGDDNSTTKDTYVLTPDTEDEGSYTYESYLNGTLVKEKSGDYEVTSNGKDTDQYEDKYESSTSSSSDNTSSSSSSSDTTSSALCTPYTNADIYHYSDYTGKWDSDRISTLDRTCSEACDASNIGDSTTQANKCSSLNYMLDYTYGGSGASDCPVCD